MRHTGTVKFKRILKKILHFFEHNVSKCKPIRRIEDRMNEGDAICATTKTRVRGSPPSVPTCLDVGMVSYFVMTQWRIPQTVHQMKQGTLGGPRKTTREPSRRNTGSANGRRKVNLPVLVTRGSLQSRHTYFSKLSSIQWVILTTRYPLRRSVLGLSGVVRTEYISKP
jgi:hypothetical protein